MYIHLYTSVSIRANVVLERLSRDSNNISHSSKKSTALWILASRNKKRSSSCAEVKLHSDSFTYYILPGAYWGHKADERVSNWQAPKYKHGANHIYHNYCTWYGKGCLKWLTWRSLRQPETISQLASELSNMWRCKVNPVEPPTMDPPCSGMLLIVESSLGRELFHPFRASTEP